MFRRRGRRNFKRRRGGRRGGYKRFVRKVRSAMSTAMEKKYFDTELASITVQTGGVLIQTSAIWGIPNGHTAGVTQIQCRTGNKVRLRYLKLNLSFFANGINNCKFRMAVIRGRTAGLGLGDCPLSSENAFWDIDKWHVYTDRVWELGSSDANGMDQVTIRQTYKIFKEAQYDTAVNTTGTTNPVYVFLWANDAVIPSPIAAGFCRQTFSDLL